jgi:hypothetical protein
MKLEFSRQFKKKKKILRYKLHDSPSSGSRVVTFGHAVRQTDRHDEANNRFSQFYERA